MQVEDRSIEEVAERIQTREDFERFLRLLVEDFQINSDAWENAELPHFLAGLQGYIHDTAGSHYDQPTWHKTAVLLLAARVYE